MQNAPQLPRDATTRLGMSHARRKGLAVVPCGGGEYRLPATATPELSRLLATPQNSLLHIAACRGLVATVSTLLSKGAAPDSRNAAGETPRDAISKALRRGEPIVDYRRFATALLAAEKAGAAEIGDLALNAAIPGYGHEWMRSYNGDALGYSYMHSPWGTEGEGFLNLRRYADEKSLSLDKMRALFARHDGDGTGSLDRNEFLQALTGLNLKLSGWELDAVVQMADKNGDGQIDAAEFVASMSDYKQNTSRMLNGNKKLRSGGVSDAMTWPSGADDVRAGLRASSRELRAWLRAPAHYHGFT